MNKIRHWWLATAGVAVLVAIIGAGAVMAQTPSTTPSTTPGASPTVVPGTSNGQTFKSNEDPTHEKAETAQQEAAEDSGQGFHGGFPGGKSNEDPTHEKGESAAREAQEDAGQAPSSPAPSASPSATN